MMKRCLAVVLVALLLAPSLALAQATKAGVVTTLEGNVTARRVALPDAVPLKFKDDIFLQDQVATGDKSLARMLLGGKAVVTVRERSLLTITEVPGKSTIDLASGKFSLAVAREKMRPDEEILIRTPNAVAGVRGTVVVTEVNRQGAQLTGAPAVVTNFYVLRGTITAQVLDVATRQPLGTPLQIGTLQAYTGAGSAPPRVAPIPPAQVGQITSGLSPTGPKGGGDAGKEQVKAQAVQAAVALLTALTDGTGGIQFALGTAPPLAPGGLTPTTSTAPIVAVTSEIAKAQELAATSTAGGLPRSFNSAFTDTSTSTLISLSGKTVNLTGVNENAIEVLSGGDVSLAGLLLTLTNSTLTATGILLAIEKGKLTSTSTSPLFSLDSSTIEVGDELIGLNNGTLTLAGALLKDTNGTLEGESEFLVMKSGSTLKSTGTGALVQLTGTTVDFDAALSMTDSTMTLSGPLASVTSVKGTDTPSGSLTPLFQLDASTLTSTGTGALLSFTSTDATADGNFLRLQNKSTVELAGSLLSGTGGKLGSGGAFISVLDSSKVTSTGTSALVSLDNTPLTLRTVTQGATTERGHFLNIGGVGSMNLKGPLLSVSNGSTLSMTGSLVNVAAGGQIIESHPTSPHVSITGGTHKLASDSTLPLFGLFGRSTATTSETVTFGTLDIASSTLTLGTDQPLQRSGAGAFLEISGATVSVGKGLNLDTALLSASGPLLNLKSGATLTSATDGLNLVSQAKLTATGPLAKLDASTLTITNGHAFRIMGGSFLNVTGDLFSIANASKFNITGGGVLFISGSSVVKISGALVNFGGSGSNQLNISNSFSPGSCTSCGDLSVSFQNGASASNVSITNAVKNSSLGTVTLSSGSHIILDGANSKLVITGN
jgi:hypothetical protein